MIIRANFNIINETTCTLHIQNNILIAQQNQAMTIKLVVNRKLRINLSTVDLKQSNNTIISRQCTT